MRIIATGSDRRRKESQGFSMIEVLVSISVLTVGVLSLAQLIPSATKTDFRSRTDSTAVFIAMRELEQMLAQPFTTTSFTDAADGSGATAPTVNLAAGGATLLNGDIDWTAAAVSGYSRTYTIAQPSGSTITVNGGSYAIRWNVSVTNGVRMIVIAARPTANLPGMIPVPANLRAVQMR